MHVPDDILSTEKDLTVVLAFQTANPEAILSNRCGFSCFRD